MDQEGFPAAANRERVKLPEKRPAFQRNFAYSAIPAIRFVSHPPKPRPAPASVADARYLATDAATPYLATFDAADAGNSVHYFCRWVNTRNQPGPWSETVTATISG